MKTQELRLGNWITGTSAEKYTGQVSKILKENVSIGSKVRFIPIEHCEPVPLTEDWLVKFGFVNKERILSSDVISYRNKDGYEIRFYIEYYFIFRECAGIVILYVHQLQNLYFALTGEELQLKEE